MTDPRDDPHIEDHGLALAWEEIPIPALPKLGGGPGYGTAIAVRRDPPALFWTRMYGGVPKPWSRFDLASGQLSTTSTRGGLHGDLRDALIPDTGSAAWLLLTYALVRVDLDTLAETAVLRAHWPQHRHHLFELGPGLLAATGWTGDTVTIVDTTTLSIARTIRTPSPDAVRWDARGLPELLAFNAQVARTLDPSTFKFVGQRALPLGKGSFVGADGHVWFVEGTRRVEPRAPTVRLVTGQRVSELDGVSLEVVRRSPALHDPLLVLGLDHVGRPVVRLRTGLAILDAGTLEPLATLTYRWGTNIQSAALLPGARSAAVLPNSSPPERLWLVRW